MTSVWSSVWVWFRGWVWFSGWVWVWVWFSGWVWVTVGLVLGVVLVWFFLVVPCDTVCAEVSLATRFAQKSFYVVFSSSAVACRLV